MFKSVKSQIIATTSLIIILILGASAYLVIDQKVKEINLDIFQKAVSFSELTHERIITNYENNYAQQAYAYFNRELADIFALNPDVIDISIFNYSGDALYKSESRTFSQLSDEDLDRVQHVFPSVKVKGDGRVVYLEKTDDELRFTNLNGRDVEPVKSSDQIEDIIYPFKDPNNPIRQFSVRYFISYSSLAERIRATTVNILAIAIVGIVIAIFVGGVVAHKITSPIKALTEGARKIGSGDLKTRINVKSKTEVGNLADTFNKMAADLETSTQAMIEKEKLTRELELAGSIQRNLLPKELPKIHGLDIAASVNSAEEVGGDVYDFLQKNNELIFYVGDVTGHGVPAGLVSAINNALVPTLLEYHDIPSDLITHLNRILKIKTQPNVFMTMVLAAWNMQNQELSFTQAGHDPIVHFKASDNVAIELGTGGMALGMIDDVSKIVKTETIPVAIGDVIVLYTDGIPEAWKNKKENYGMERFKESIMTHSSKASAQKIHDALVKDVRDFMGDYPQADDITLIVLKRTA